MGINFMKNKKELRKFKRRMIRKPTKYEKLFMEHLKNEKLDFKQQVITGFYIADFIIPSKMFIIEIDGESHNKRKRYDFIRDKFLNQCGFQVMRITNEEIKNGVLEKYKFSNLPDYPQEHFRSGLAKANSVRGIIIKRNRENYL